MWLGRTYSEGLMSTFYRFLARFSGRRRGPLVSRMRLPLLSVTYLIALHILTPFVEGCSSRSTPKARPNVGVSTPRPNITFRTFNCPPMYDTWYCNNGATCFMVKIGESYMYNCECADGYMGQRCEFKNLDGTYLPTRQRVMLETASIASGLMIAVILVIILMAVYVHYQRKAKHAASLCEVDGAGDLERRAPFSRRDPSRIPLRQIPPDTKYPVGLGDSLTASVYAGAAVQPASLQPP